MTYSYVRQAWVNQQLLKGVFGITTISRAAGIPESTGKTWLRQGSCRLPSHKKMPREYERALGILLLERYPDSKLQIAKMVFTTPRMLHEWDLENRLHSHTSDLRRQTAQMVIFLRPFLKDYFDREDGGSISLTQGRFPESANFEKKFFEMLDLVLYMIIELESEYRAARVIKSWSKYAEFMSAADLFQAEIDLLRWRESTVHVPMYGPHKHRFVQHNYHPDYPFYWGDTQPYKPGRLSGVNLGGEYDPFRTMRMRIHDFIHQYGMDNYEAEVESKIIDLKAYFERREEQRQEKSKNIKRAS